MKNLLLLLSSLCFASTLLADDVYDEQIQILRTGEVIAAEDILAGGSAGPVLDACYAGLSALEKDASITGIAPTLGARVKLNAVETQKSDGTVVTKYDENSDDCQNYTWTGTEWKKICTDIEAVVEVGEMLVCQDWLTYFWGAGVNLVPVYYEITVGDITYIASGAGQSPAFANLPVLPGGGQILAPQFIGEGNQWVAGFPAAGVYMMSFGASILPGAAVGEVPPFSPPGFGGTFTSNAVADTQDVEDQFETEAMITIRTYTPVSD
jgi:hypothetical protein